MRPHAGVIGLVASDFDGTLARKDRTISARVRESLVLLHDAGIDFAVITGRPPRFANSIVDMTGVPTTLICSNGAVVYDPDRGEVLASDNLQLSAAVEIVQLLRDAFPDAAFAAEQGTDFAGERGFAEALGREPETDLVDVLDAIDDQLHKMIVALPDVGPDDAMARIAPVVGDRVSISHAGLPFVELAAPGVSKATGLERLATRLGHDARHVVAFGDMPNDIPMLEWAGWGVAMANGHETAIAVANEVTGTNEEDGVAQILEQIFG